MSTTRLRTGHAARLLPLGAAALVIAWLVSGTCRADIWILIENPNGIGRFDRFEIYDKVCDEVLPGITLRGHTSQGVSICGGLDRPGSIRIRYVGDTAWTEVGGLHSWSVVQAPRRPMGMVTRPREKEGD